MSTPTNQPTINDGKDIHMSNDNVTQAHRDNNGRLLTIGARVTDGRTDGVVVTYDDAVIVWQATLAGYVYSHPSALSRVNAYDA